MPAKKERIYRRSEWFYSAMFLISLGILSWFHPGIGIIIYCGISIAVVCIWLDTHDAPIPLLGYVTPLIWALIIIAAFFMGLGWLWKNTFVRFTNWLDRDKSSKFSTN